MILLTISLEEGINADLCCYFKIPKYIYKLFSSVLGSSGSFAGYMQYVLLAIFSALNLQISQLRIHFFTSIELIWISYKLE